MNTSDHLRLTRRAPLLAALLLAPLGLPAGAAAQSAAEVLDRAVELHEQRTAGVDNYTIVQHIEGGEMLDPAITYFEKTVVDGHPVFIVHDDALDSIAVLKQRGGLRDQGSLMAELRDRATLVGTETIDGEATWIVRVDDASDLNWAGEMSTSGAGPEGAPSGEATIRTLTLAIDQDDYVARRVSIEGEIDMNGASNPFTTVMNMSDYRNVEGVLHPFRVEMRMAGMAGMAGGQSPEEQAEMRKNLAEARRMLDEMPEAQRAMAEQAMGGQLANMEAMLAEGEFVVTTVVDEIRVNTGPPEGGP